MVPPRKVLTAWAPNVRTESRPQNFFHDHQKNHLKSTMRTIKGEARKLGKDFLNTKSLVFKKEGTTRLKEGTTRLKEGTTRLKEGTAL